ncbi:MAG TPA: MFS transporter, partial [Spirochaetia bacterium]|nr:MFS transporter [Spirochaetia bacterium]
MTDRDREVVPNGESKKSPAEQKKNEHSKESHCSTSTRRVYASASRASSLYADARRPGTLLRMQSGIAIHLKRLVLPVYLPMALVSVAISAPVAAFPQYLAGLGATVGLVGIIISLRGVGNMVSDLPGGLILGRYRLRGVVQTALILAAVASAGMALVKSVAAIAILVLITGAMASVVVTAMMTYVRMAVPADSRGRALSLTGGSVRIGALAGPILGGVLADLAGVPAALWLRAGCFLAAFLVLVVSPDRNIDASSEESIPVPQIRPGLRGQLRAIRDGLRGKGHALATVGFAILMLQLLRASRTIILPLWGDRLGLSATLIGSVMSIGAALELALFVPSGIIMDRSGRKTAAALCIGIFSVGVFVLPFSVGMAGFVLASLLIGLGNGFGSGINMTIGTDLAPSNAVSEFLGLWRLFGDIGTSAGPAIVGG